MNEVVIRFSQPVALDEPGTGELVMADRHTVLADLIQQDADWTVVLDDQGTIIARWATRLVDRFEWRPGPRVGTRDWLDGVKQVNPRAYEPWTDAEDDRLTDEFQSGLSVAEIARRHERRPGAIESRLRKLDLA